LNKDKQYKPKIYNVSIDGQEINYILIRSSRKTVGISIEKDGTVKVTCPYKVSDSYINELLQKKSKWILNKLQSITARECKVKKIFEDGEYFNYLGKKCKIQIVKESRLKEGSALLENDTIIVFIPNSFEADDIKNTLKLWYIKRFKAVIEERIKYYSLLLGVCPRRVTVKEQKTRWGSCSTKGNINLNWKLIMASMEVLDYVVVHELCHMREMNHKKEFWRLVESVFPKYKECRAWLKENGDSLSLE
jgi:predicted metal-dependent hydrolase